jgi:hypothetical protein
MLETVKKWIGALTEVGLLLLAFAIVAALLVGANLPFFGDVVMNIMALVKSLGDAGLVGLIALAICSRSRRSQRAVGLGPGLDYERDETI